MSMVSIREKLNRIYELVGGIGENGGGTFDSPAMRGKNRDSGPSSEMRDLLNNSPDVGIMQTPEMLGSMGTSAPPLLDPVSQAAVTAAVQAQAQAREAQKREDNYTGDPSAAPPATQRVDAPPAASGVPPQEQDVRAPPQHHVVGQHQFSSGVEVPARGERVERQPQTISDDLRRAQAADVQRTASAAATNVWASTYIATAPPESPPKKRYAPFSTEISPIPNNAPSSAARSHRTENFEDSEQPSRLSFRGPIIDGFGFAKITSPGSLRNTAPYLHQQNPLHNGAGGGGAGPSSSMQPAVEAEVDDREHLVRRLTFLERMASQPDLALRQECERLGLLVAERSLPRHEMMQRLEGVYCSRGGGPEVAAALGKDPSRRTAGASIPTSQPPQRQVSSSGVDAARRASIDRRRDFPPPADENAAPAQENVGSGGPQLLGGGRVPGKSVSKRKRTTDEMPSPARGKEQRDEKGEEEESFDQHSAQANAHGAVRTKAPPPAHLPGSRGNSAAPTPLDSIGGSLGGGAAPPLSGPPKKRPGQSTTRMRSSTVEPAIPRRESRPSRRQSQRKSDAYLRPEHHECPADIPLEAAVIDRLRESFHGAAAGELTLPLRHCVDVVLQLAEAVSLELTELDVVRRFSRFDFEGTGRLPFAGFCSLCASLDIVVPLDEMNPGDVGSVTTPFSSWDSDLRSCVELLPGPDPTTEHLFPLTHRRFSCRTGPWDDERPRDAPREEEAYRWEKRHTVEISPGRSSLPGNSTCSMLPYGAPVVPESRFWTTF